MSLDPAQAPGGTWSGQIEFEYRLVAGAREAQQGRQGRHGPEEGQDLWGLAKKFQKFRSQAVSKVYAGARPTSTRSPPAPTSAENRGGAPAGHWPSRKFSWKTRGLPRRGPQAQREAPRFPSDRAAASAPPGPAVLGPSLLCRDRPAGPRAPDPQAPRPGRRAGHYGARARPPRRGPVFPRFARGGGKIFPIQKLTAGLCGRPRGPGGGAGQGLLPRAPEPLPAPFVGAQTAED